jgi:hypothetical protein
MAKDPARPSLGECPMTDQERAQAIYSLQEIARDHARMEQAWVDVVIAAMELEFLE